MSETVASGTTAGRRSLVCKLAAVMGEVERIPKSGRNAFHNYDYATEADIVAAVRKGMATRALMLVPDVEAMEWRDGRPDKGGKPTKVCTLRVRFRLMDGESGEQMDFVVIGEGDGADDKATYKAMTGATKYALLKLFLIPTGDDPEADSTPPPSPTEAARQQIWSAPAQSETPASAPAQSGYVIKFGNNKGKTLAELSDADLVWHTKKAAEDVAKNDPKWHAKNLEALKAMEAEQARRRGAGVGAGPKKETQYETLQRLMAERGLDPSQWGPVYKQVMAPRIKTTQTTAADVAKVLAAFPQPPEQGVSHG